jgi:hypothetical protein
MSNLNGFDAALLAGLLDRPDLTLSERAALSRMLARITEQQAAVEAAGARLAGILKAANAIEATAENYPDLRTIRTLASIS